MLTPEEYHKKYLELQQKRIDRKKRLKERQHKYSQNNRLGTIEEGQRLNIFVKKEEYPINCELCNKKRKRLNYHHWGKIALKRKAYVPGLWVCMGCHRLVEFIDAGTSEFFIAKYNSSKDSAQNNNPLLISSRHMVRTSNKIVAYPIKKRHKPLSDNCELCDSHKGRLNYHLLEKLVPHNFVKGVWVCLKCLRIVAIIDQISFEELKHKYLEIKKLRMIKAYNLNK